MKGALPKTLKVRARVTCPHCAGEHTPFVEVTVHEAARALAHIQRVEWRQDFEIARAAEREERGADVVYVARNPRSGHVKIGVASSVARRLSEFRRASGEPIELVAIVGYGYSLEQKLHGRFAAARLRGEWFDPANPELAHWLQRIQGVA